MKILSLKSSFLLFAIALMTISLSSCKKDQTTTDVTEEDAADAIATTMARPTGGTAEDFGEAVSFARIKILFPQQPLKKWLECGQTKDTSFTKNFNDGTNSFTHTRKWTVTLNCNAEQKPESLVWTGNFSGSFDAPKMSGNSTGTRNWTLTGFGPDFTQLKLNGTISRNGMRTSKVRNKLSFETTINHTYTDVTINKETEQITGGTGTVSAIIKISNGNTKTFNGTVLFNANGTATLTINGRVFTIQLY